MVLIKTDGSDQANHGGEYLPNECDSTWERGVITNMEWSSAANCGLKKSIVGESGRLGDELAELAWLWGNKNNKKNGCNIVTATNLW